MGIIVNFLLALCCFAESAHAYPCGSAHCECSTALLLTDCSDLALKSVPVFTLNEVYEMKYVYLQENLLININEDDFLTEIWQDLIYINLRENPKLNCTTLANIDRIITVHTDCADESSTLSTAHDITSITMDPTYTLSDQTMTYELTSEAQEMNTTDISSKGKNQVVEIVLGSVISGILLVLLIAIALYMKYCRSVQQSDWERIREENPIYRPTTVSNDNAVFPADFEI